MSYFRGLPFLVLALMLPVVALAQVIDPSTDLDGFLKQFLAAISGGDWRAVAVLAAIGGIWGLRKLGKKIPGKVGAFLDTARGGAIFALLFATLMGLGSAIIAGQAINLKLILDVLLYGFTAIGGWVGIRRILGIDAATVVNAEAGKVVTTPGDAGSIAAGLDPRVK